LHGAREKEWEREDSKDERVGRDGDGEMVRFLYTTLAKQRRPRSEPALPEVVALDLDRRTPCRMQRRQTRSRRDPRFPRPANRLIVYFIFNVNVMLFKVISQLYLFLLFNAIEIRSCLIFKKLLKILKHVLKIKILIAGIFLKLL